MFQLADIKQNEQRIKILQRWQKDGGVLILGYSLFRILTSGACFRKKRQKERLLQVVEQTLLNPGPDLVICDEGHMLKNETAAISKQMNRIHTLRRICLTGTPLQNNLEECKLLVSQTSLGVESKYFRVFFLLIPLQTLLGFNNEFLT